MSKARTKQTLAGILLFIVALLGFMWQAGRVHAEGPTPTPTVAPPPAVLNLTVVPNVATAAPGTLLSFTFSVVNSGGVEAEFALSAVMTPVAGGWLVGESTVGCNRGPSEPGGQVVTCNGSVAARSLGRLDFVNGTATARIYAVAGPDCGQRWRADAILMWSGAPIVRSAVIQGLSCPTPTPTAVPATPTEAPPPPTPVTTPVAVAPSIGTVSPIIPKPPATGTGLAESSAASWGTVVTIAIIVVWWVAVGIVSLMFFRGLAEGSGWTHFPWFHRRR